uniref:Uncharacterized protein n=1 Tax=Trichuris muris TaxID=70415 RepID=A0A5S6QNN1_TRIMR
MEARRWRLVSAGCSSEYPASAATVTGQPLKRPPKLHSREHRAFQRSAKAMAAGIDPLDDLPCCGIRMDPRLASIRVAFIAAPRLLRENPGCLGWLNRMLSSVGCLHSFVGRRWKAMCISVRMTSRKKAE